MYSSSDCEKLGVCPICGIRPTASRLTKINIECLDELLYYIIITEMKKSNLILISAYVMQKRTHLWNGI